MRSMYTQFVTATCSAISSCHTQLIFLLSAPLRDLVTNVRPQVRELVGGFRYIQTNLVLKEKPNDKPANK